MMKNKIKQILLPDLVRRYKFTKIILGILILLLISMSLLFVALKMNTAGYLLMFVAYLILLYLPYYYVSFITGVSLMLFDGLDPLTPISFWNKTKALKGNVLAVNKAFFYTMAGQFDEADDSLNQVNLTRLNKKLVCLYIYTESLIQLLKYNKFNKADFDHRTKLLSSQKKIKEMNRDRSRLLQAIFNIQNKQPDDYFDKTMFRNNLDRLIANYYQAKNELLKGETERACELFQKVAVENDDIYFVREAKKMLGELSHDRPC